MWMQKHETVPFLRRTELALCRRRDQRPRQEQAATTISSSGTTALPVATFQTHTRIVDYVTLSGFNA